LFLNDPRTGELYSRVTHGSFRREIRFLNDEGVAGRVFRSGRGEIVPEAYADSHFNPKIDQKTGITTRNIIAVPIRTAAGEIIGVAESINRRGSAFTPEDLETLEELTTQASIFLKSTQFAEEMERAKVQELEFLDMVSGITSEIDLSAVLRKVMSEATRLLDAERSTLFLNDEKTGELWSQVGEGLTTTQIRMPNHVGIAGAVFTSGATVNIPHAYADLRFNPEFDRKTGFFTRSILCVPVVNKEGRTIGVTQVLNKKGGVFTEEDESRLKAFTAQIAVGLENAKLFNDIQNMKNYNEGMLRSMSNGVLTLDAEGRIHTCNDAGQRILGMERARIVGVPAAELFTERGAWVAERIRRVDETQRPDVSMDAELELGARRASVNLTVLPLLSTEETRLGTMLVLEDITGEKRVKATMSRYMDPSIADQLLQSEDILGGKSTPATVLFTDIRGFTTLAEKLGAAGTVSFLNEYFTLMVECLQREGGMLDKFIGDAIMAAFGIPLGHGDDEDRGVRAAIEMIRTLDGWNEVRRARGEDPVDMGIGLNTDTVVSGNIGSPRRMDYTIIGDGVNLAARLESACKQYFSRILISENTYRKLRGTYRIREIDRVVVKGKTEPVGVYEVLDYHTEQTFPNLMEAVGHFKEGQGHYRAGRWDPAIRSFGEALRLNSADRLAAMYVQRCERLKAEPPGEGWNGVWVMTAK
jgi:adenylate cyclase